MWFYEVMGNINLTTPNAATFMPSWIGNISIVLKLPKWGQNLSKSIEQCQNDRPSQQVHFNFRLSSSVWCTMSRQDAKKNVSTWYWNSSKQTGKKGGVSEFFLKRALYYLADSPITFSWFGIVCKVCQFCCNLTFFAENTLRSFWRAWFMTIRPALHCMFFNITLFHLMP